MVTHLIPHGQEIPPLEEFNTAQGPSFQEIM
jgi:hypothetical protein